jgi:hypothetical protein
MMEFLRGQAGFGYTYLELFGILIGVMIASNIFTRIFGEKTGNQMLKKQCSNCRWTGPAVKTTKICPKCQGPLHTID